MNLWEAYIWAQTEEGLQAARHFLEWPKRAENRLTILYARADSLREKVYSPYYIRETPGGAGQADRVGELAVRLADIETETETLLHLLTEAVRRRKAMIDEVDREDVRQALHYHYLDHMSSTAASMRMHMDERQYFRKLRQGCVQIAMQLALDEEWMAQMEAADSCFGRQDRRC